MIASRLLGYYPQISDTPDAVQRMRQLILNLAVRGRLVPQDPDDEPASKLSDRISAERARLVKAGEIKAPPRGPRPKRLLFLSNCRLDGRWSD